MHVIVYIHILYFLALRWVGSKVTQCQMLIAPHSFTSMYSSILQLWSVLGTVYIFTSLYYRILLMEKIWNKKWLTLVNEVYLTRKAVVHSMWMCLSEQEVYIWLSTELVCCAPSIEVVQWLRPPITETPGPPPYWKRIVGKASFRQFESISWFVEITILNNKLHNYIIIK